MPEIMRKPLSWFHINPQIRLDLGHEADLRNLGESLMQRQLSPVGALADGELIYGFRRFRAAQLVGLTELDVTVYVERLTPTEITVIQVTENIQRLEMSAFERYSAYEQLRQLNPNWSAKTLAEHLHLDPSSVTKYLSASKCIPAWRDALREGIVGISDCYLASQVSEEEQASMLLMKLAGASRDAIQRQIQRTKPSANQDHSRASRVSVVLSSGAKIVLSGQKFSLHEVIERLGECLEAAKKGLKDRIDLRTWEKVMRDRSSSQGDTSDAV